MLYCPKFSIGSLVDIQELDERGKIVGIQATHEVNEYNEDSYHVKYLVEVEGYGRMRFTERVLSDVKELSPGIVDEMDVFLADSLMLSWKLNPEMINKAVRELLKVEAGGIDDGSKECDDCSL